MKHLLVFRHAKAEPGRRDRDFERDLVERGEKDARHVGRALAHAEQVPDRVVASAARRARRTAEIAHEAGRWRSALRLEEAIYDSSVDRLVNLLRVEADDAGSLCVVGHEPTLSELVAVLIGGGRIHLPPAGCVRIDLAVERWRDLRPGCGVLAWMLVPKVLREL